MYGQFLGCDSGGWYHLEHIARILHPGVTEHEPDIRTWRPDWVYKLRDRLKGRSLLNGMTIKAWLAVIMHALRPESHVLPRYQVVLEKDHGQGPTDFVRPYAVRAASGHSGINILDPERLAAMVPEGISSYVSVICHITEMNNLSDIFPIWAASGWQIQILQVGCAFCDIFPDGSTK